MLVTGHALGHSDCRIVQPTLNIFRSIEWATSRGGLIQGEEVKDLRILVRSYKPDRRHIKESKEAI